MSSTRRAKDDSVFHQSRFASSPEFARGLIANLVAKRCSVLDSAADRELIWFLQYLSHGDGGVAAVAADLVCKYPERVQTSAMLQMGLKPGELHSSPTVKKLRWGMPLEAACQFELAGERAPDDWEGGLEPKDDYPAEKFFEVCAAAARHDLEKYLQNLCLDPEETLAGGPWYFADLSNVLRDYHRQWIAEKSKVVVTKVGQKVFETLDYTASAGILSLLVGELNLGQSFAAHAWCEQHSGHARYVEVPPSNDEASFFRAIARALGLGNFLNYKNVQIRERVEFVLQSGDILLVVNQAQNLWPQKNLREAFPGRLAWLLDQVDAGAKACMISGPQFFMQKRACEKTGWDSPLLQGKILHYDHLPTSLDVEDLKAVGRVILPEANDSLLEIVAGYAVGSERYLGALEAIAKRAQFIASKDGRNKRTVQDVRAALKAVDFSNKQLRQAITHESAGMKPGAVVPAQAVRTITAMLEAPEAAQVESATVRRGTVPTGIGSRNRASQPASFTEA